MVEYSLSIENEILAPFQDNFVFTSSSSGSEKKMNIFHKQIVEILRPLEKVTDCGFLVSTVRGQEWNCFLNLVSYSSEIPQGKYRSEIRNWLPVSSPSGRSVSTLADFRTMKVIANISMEHTQKLLLHVSSLLLQADYLCFQGNIHERRDSMREALEALNNFPMEELPSFLEN